MGLEAAAERWLTRYRYRLFNTFCNLPFADDVDPDPTIPLTICHLSAALPISLLKIQLADNLSLSLPILLLAYFHTIWIPLVMTYIRFLLILLLALADRA